MSNYNYVLITSARNEEKFIEKTIYSVINQTKLPLKWVIVNDSSTDRTSSIIDHFAKSHPFIEHIKKNDEGKREFGSKSKAVSLAYDRIKPLTFEYLGILDADMHLQSNYYEEIINRMESNDNLGIVGGIRYDTCKGKQVRVHQPSSSVSGSIQFFRRNCFEIIGGYTPLKYGGIDALAEIKTKLNGWDVRSFNDLITLHLRCTGEYTGKIFRYKINQGLKYYSLGYHPLFCTLKLLKEIKMRPYLIGSLISILSYYKAMILRYPKYLTKNEVKKLRSDQMKRIFAIKS